MDNRDTGKLCDPSQDAGISSAYVPGLVSVIIPTYNRKQMVQEAIASVVRQSWPNLEILVVDDGSTDGTFQSLKQLNISEPAKLLTVLYQDHAGAAVARNLGAQNARGEFLHFLDSDDLLFPSALEKLVHATEANNSPFALAHIHNSTQNGQILAQDTSGISRLHKENILFCRWMTHAALYRRSTLVSTSLFNVDLKTAEDSEFHWRVAALFREGLVIPEYIGLRRQHALGHLGFNRTDACVIRESIKAKTLFADWLQAKNIRKMPVNWRFFKHTMGLGIRAGSRGDWHHKNMAFLLPAKYGSRLSQKMLAKIIGWPKKRLYYAIILIVFENTVKVRGV